MHLLQFRGKQLWLQCEKVIGDREFYLSSSLFPLPDGLQENGSLAAKAVGKQDTKCDPCDASNPCTTTQIGLCTPSTATTTDQRAGGLATGSFVQHSGEQDPGHRSVSSKQLISSKARGEIGGEFLLCFLFKCFKMINWYLYRGSMASTAASATESELGGGMPQKSVTLPLV